MFSGTPDPPADGRDPSGSEYPLQPPLPSDGTGRSATCESAVCMDNGAPKKRNPISFSTDGAACWTPGSCDPPSGDLHSVSGTRTPSGTIPVSTHRHGSAPAHGCTAVESG
mmetsp:Transcript_3618/g.5359  ORF Transcript_3618/g.5359 Transcript_3618/m.5359 type:complete len:111 (-) Transcript_3618:109-441(-)